MTENFAELFEQSIATTQLRSGAIVIGTVLEITNDSVIVNAGLKSEGVIPKTQFMNPKIQIMLFTSTSHGSGCSSTTAGFATSLAKTFRNRVLLVDVNMRTPGMHKFFQDDSTVGLFDLFSKRGPKIEKKRAQNLYVVTCNQNLGDEIDGFFGSDRFMEFLSQMRQNFDYVILDGPPVLACSESLVIGAKVDGVILTIESGKTRRSVALKAKKEIEGSGGKFLGVVLNKREYYIPKWIYKRL